MKKLLSLTLALLMLVGCLSLTAFAGEETYDYTLVLVDGKARKDSEDGVDVTAEMETKGLTYDDGVWTMNNFNFTTSNAKGMMVASDTTINVVGNNSITVLNSTTSSAPMGLQILAGTTLQGTGTLTVNAGSGEGHIRGIAISNSDISILIKDITLISNAANSTDFSSYGWFSEESNVTVTIDDANVTLNAGAVSKATRESIGMYAGSSVIVLGNGKITGNGNTASTGSVVGINGLGDSTSAVGTDGNGTALIWNEDDSDFKDAQDNFPKTTVLTSTNPYADPAITSGNAQTVDITKEESATFVTNIVGNKLSKVLVDGKEITSDNYLLDTGSGTTATITLIETYIATLDAGSHTVTFVATYGQAEGTFTVTTYATPAITAGNAQTVDIIKKEAAKFETNIVGNQLSKVLVDGKELTLGQYFSLAGSGATANISLSSDFIGTLDVGSHTVTFVATYGQVEGTFTVTEIEETTTEEITTESTTTEEATTEAPKKEEPVEEEQDNSWIVALIIVIVIVAGGACAYIFRDKITAFLKKHNITVDHDDNDSDNNDEN